MLSEIVSWENLNILIVEDEEDLRTVLVTFFAKRGAHMYSAADGLAGYQIIIEQKIDLVISDVQMPLCSGIELVAKIRARDRKLPVVLLTTGFADITAEDAKVMGAAGLLQKPFRMAALMSMIEAALVSV